MTRRRIVILCLVAAALLAALSPWTVSSDRVVSALARQIKQGYGVSLTSNGSLDFTLLPTPQLVLSGVRLASADGVAEAEAEELRAQLRLLPLIQARLRLSKVSLARSRIVLHLGQRPEPSTAEALAWLRGRIATDQGSRWVPRIDRFILTEAEVTIRDAAGRDLARLRRASLALNSPEPDGDLALTASAQWNGETAFAALSGLNLAAIREGRASTIEGEVSARPGRLKIEGHLTWADAPRFVGAARGQTTSLARLAAWVGVGADVAAVDRPAAIFADGTIGLDKLELPRATLEFGRDRLEGAVAVQLGGRPAIRATLAGGDLDLGWLGRVVDPGGQERLHADYDVRLSSSSLALGPLRLREAALSVQSTARGTEVSLGRAGFAGGSLRGRLSAASDGEAREMRVLAWADGVDLERALGEVAGVRGIAGTATGQFTLDISGDRGERIAQQLRGRGSLQARDGEVSGIAVAEGGKRMPPGALASEWRAGRVRFSQASVALEFGGGRAEIGNGSLHTTGARASVAGRVELETLDAALQLTLRPPGASAAQARPLVLDLAGPLQRLLVSTAVETTGSP